MQKREEMEIRMKELEHENLLLKEMIEEMRKKTDGVSKDEYEGNDAFLDNIADICDNSIMDHTDCEECMEDFVFKMRDNYHEFYIGLSTILTCLYQAIEAGVVPELPKGWWGNIMGRYEVDF